MANIAQLISDGGNAILMVSAADLNEFARQVFNDAYEAGKKAQQPEKYLTVKEAATMTGKSIATLWRWDKAGYLKPIKVGRTPKYRFSDIQKIMEG